MDEWCCGTFSFFWPGWDLLFVHFEDIWLLELHSNSPVGFSHIFFYKPLLIDLVFLALCKRLHSFSRCPPVQWAVSSPVTHFLSHQNYRPPLQQLDVCVCVCVGGKKKEPIPWAARDTDTNVSPRASIKLCRPFSCLPTTWTGRASPSPSRRRALEMIPSVWHKSEIICSRSHPDRGHRCYWNKHWLGRDCRKKKKRPWRSAQWNITVFILEN